MHVRKPRKKRSLRSLTRSGCGDDAPIPDGHKLGRSDALHADVLAYAARDAYDADAFTDLADRIASFQAECQPGYRRLRRRVQVGPLSQLRAVTTDVFRFSNVYNFHPNQAAAEFRTSGTTTPHPGRHWMRRTETYCQLSLQSGRAALLQELRGVKPRVLALMPAPASSFSSSLSFMCAQFMAEFDACGLASPREPRTFSVREPQRWLLKDDGVELPSLRRQLQDAAELGEPVILLTTSFALVMLLDQLAGSELRLPAGSVLMTTGGFKGRTRTVDGSELYARAFEVLTPSCIVGEYGMTELSSQLYEAPSRSTDAAFGKKQGLYFEPSWLRVIPVDPATHAEVPDGGVGLACFVDLGNVDSAVCVLTQDLVRREAGGVRLLGRAPRAVVRGCSLAVEESWASRVLPTARAAKRLSFEIPPHAVDAAAKDRVQRLLAAGAQIKDPTSELGRRARAGWLKTSGLSIEAIELSVQRAMESQVSAEQLEEFCANVAPAPRAWVNLSANVPVAAQRAIALALAASDQVSVRPSRRDPVLAKLLYEATCTPTGSLFNLVTQLTPLPGDHVFAYGSDETLAELRQTLPAGIQFHPHGSGFGAVVFFAEDDLIGAAAAVASDVVLFEQQGCLSPRIVLLTARAGVDEFIGALAAQLSCWAERIPAGSLAESLAGEQAWSRSTLEQIAEVVDAGRGFVALQREPAPWLLAPPLRNLVVYVTADPIALIRQLGPQLTTIACASETRRQQLLSAAPQARLCALGQMQTPAFDGPVDRRGA